MQALPLYDVKCINQNSCKILSSDFTRTSCVCVFFFCLKLVWFIFPFDYLWCAIFTLLKWTHYNYCHEPMQGFSFHIQWLFLYTFIKFVRYVGLAHFWGWWTGSLCNCTKHIACFSCTMDASNQTPTRQQYLLSIKIPPHKFLHDFLHPHLQAYEADAVAPPQPEQIQ